MMAGRRLARLLAGGRRGGVHGRTLRGFSLLEALVAMAIASIAFAVLYRTVGQSSKNVVDVEARVEAALVARSILASATFAEDLVRQSSGQSGVWHWAVQVAPEQIAVTETGERPSTAPMPAARVVINVAREGGPPVLTWTTWKPYRAAP